MIFFFHESFAVTPPLFHPSIALSLLIKKLEIHENSPIMDASDPWLIFFFIFGSISTLVTCCVISNLLWQYGFHQLFQDVRLSLLLLLHFTVFLEDISNFPLIYVNNLGICQFMGWLHYYSGLANVIGILLMGFHYFSFLNYEWISQDVEKWLYRYAWRLSFSFPLITLLPFSQSAYGIQNNLWCTLPSNERIPNNWSLGVFYSWTFFFLFISISQLFFVYWRFYSLKLHFSWRLFASVGVYIVISIVCWLPRLLPRILYFMTSLRPSNLFLLHMTLLLYLSGLFYAIFYVVDITCLENNRARSNTHTMQMSEISPASLDNIFRVTGEGNSIGEGIGGGGGGGDNPLHSSKKKSSNPFLLEA